MASRFYFVPVEDGLARLGAGLARGIYGATGQYERMRERQRRQPIEDLERALFEAQAYEAGVRRGPRPTRTIEPTPQVELPDFRRGPLFPDADADVGVRTALERAGDTPLGRSRLLPETSWMREPPALDVPDSAYRVEIPDPDTIQLSDDFWLESPESRARRRLQFERETRDQELEELASLLDEAATSGEITPGVAVRFPALLDRYFRSRGIGGPYEPVRGTPEWLDALEDELKLRSQYDAERASPGITPTARYMQNAYLARRFLNEIAAINAWEPKPGESPEEFRRAQEEARERLREVYQMNEEQANQLIRYGPDVIDEWTSPSERLDDEDEDEIDALESQLGGRGTLSDPFDLPPIRAIPPASRRGRSRREDPAEARLSDEQVSQIRVELRGLSRAEQEEVLREAGLSDAQIEQVLGRRERGQTRSHLDWLLNRR